MCVRCVCQDIQDRINNGYPMNRDKILTDLWTFIGINDSKELPLPKNYNKVSIDKCLIAYHKLKEICTMIEEDKEQNEIMSQLEILEVTCDFDQREYYNEEHRKHSSKRLYD
jgi:hypothetical protein